MTIVITTATVIGIMLLVAGLSLPFVSNVSATNHQGSFSSSSDSRHNVIEAACSIASIISTDGTNDPDIMLGCDLEDIMYGNAASDVLQGRFDDDKLYGNGGDDSLQGGAGGDELYAGRGDDVIFAGFDDDFLVAGEGNDELYGEDGNELLEGGDGADYFDCGDGLDVIVDYDPSKGDTHTNNCEDVRERL
jgi:Ca2+-binding RTX toxin-like protein